MFIFLASITFNKYFLQNKRAPLHWAASGGKTEITEYLLGCGVPINEPDDVSVYCEKKTIKYVKIKNDVKFYVKKFFKV